MNLKKILITLVIFLALVSVISLITVLYLFGGKAGINLSLSEWLGKVDDDLGAGYLPRAEENLYRALSFVGSATDYLQILRRAYRLDQYREQNELFNDLSWKAWSRFPRSEEIAFLAAYSALAMENPSRAWDILSDAPHCRQLDRLRLQASLQGEQKMLPQELQLDRTLARLTKLLSSRDPSDFLISGQDLQENRLLLNAALLYMARGEGDKAFQLSREGLVEERFDGPAALIALDNLQWETALFRVNRISEKFPKNAEYHALAGDFYLRTLDYDRAKSRYLKALKFAPEEGPSLYLNLSWLYQQDNRFDSAEIFLNEGLDYFPHNQDLLFEKAKLFRRQARFEDARNLLASASFPLKGNQSLLLLSLQQKVMEPARFHIKLWDIYNSDPANGLVCRTLMSVLLESDNYTDARTALELYMTRTGTASNWWLLYFKGLIMAATGDYQPAATLMAESLILREDKYVRFNHGIVLAAAGEYAAAIEEFWYVLELAREKLGEDPRFYARCVTASGEARLKQGKNQEALKQFRYALEIDPENYHALLLAKQVERMLSK